MKKINHTILLHAAIFFFVVLSFSSAAYGDQGKLNLFAGAGLKKSLDVVIEKFEKAYDVDVVPNYGPSGGLYAQISKGQPCDLYLSADWKFIKKLEKDGLLAEGKKFLTDFVVLIVSKTGEKKIKGFKDLANDGVVISIADPRAPVGRYAENGLIKLGIWESIVKKGNVKAKPSTVNQVAIMVREDQVDAGFIFKSVAAMYNLKYVEQMGPELTGEIVFGFGRIKGGNEELAKKFMKFAQDNISEFTKFGWKAYE